MKVLWRSAIALCVLALAIASWNYATLGRLVSARLAEDSRNEKVSLWAYHQYGIAPSVLVIDLRRVSADAAAIDVLRVLFHSAESLQDTKFDTVVLAYRGKAKLTLSGAHFQTVGREFKTQNPVYTMRTLPENVRKLDGSPAYGTWTGGLLGVLGKQMEDLGTFSQDWYLRDMAEELRP